MTVQDFKRLLAARPFEPFRIIMSSGERYEIRHPEMAFLTRTKIVLGLDPDREGVAEDWTFASLLHITAIEPVKGRKRTA
ncbi:MAG: hypothetical protein ACAI43_08720 [Phycisphaerae bacterium]|nr:hypothetical protein [Tepidisphaeraceae bacterium]